MQIQLLRSDSVQHSTVQDYPESQRSFQNMTEHAAAVTCKSPCRARLVIYAALPRLMYCILHCTVLYRTVAVQGSYGKRHRRTLITTSLRVQRDMSILFSNPTLVLLVHVLPREEAKPALLSTSETCGALSLVNRFEQAKPAYLSNVMRIPYLW